MPLSVYLEMHNSYGILIGNVGLASDEVALYK